MTIENEKLKLLNTWMNVKKKLSLTFFQHTKSISFWPKEKGDIFWCELGENVGSETNKKRPVLVISSSKKNKRLSHVVIAPISTTVKYKKYGESDSGLKYSHHFLLTKSNYPFLKSDSVVKIEQLRTVSKNRLIGYSVGSLDTNSLRIINKKISSFLDL
ncbi:type II toxin-antitoxin system PemK/MazF family toxin [Lactococcus lactis]|jgi:mRNA interferase MazF|uniref:type II toxin-antitoxin system PemK/MazF family toxin n=1 Tax=Lactococcus lactis TaxID=1358 RepID=UPI00155E0167|nr:type II toxin-antitoxin system PemK/MazF family toxin [Lactococcus lactis]MCT3137837.1 type II toxin-antitoxin system PemK/MazF family toxin [Lactococcus lactis]NRD17261.1 type II toxin-antitoxin system PemK/MazF family toxin [Lactococcus lactis subsp. lactis]